MKSQKVSVLDLIFSKSEYAVLKRIGSKKITAKTDLKVLKRKLQKIFNSDEESPRQVYFAKMIFYKLTGKTVDFVYPWPNGAPSRKKAETKKVKKDKKGKKDDKKVRKASKKSDESGSEKKTKKSKRRVKKHRKVEK